MALTRTFGVLPPNQTRGPSQTSLAEIYRHRKDLNALFCFRIAYGRTLSIEGYPEAEIQPEDFHIQLLAELYVSLSIQTAPFTTNESVSSWKRDVGLAFAICSTGQTHSDDLNGYHFSRLFAFLQRCHLSCSGQSLPDSCQSLRFDGRLG